MYIAGADNKASYQNILSLDLGGILLDELSALHPDVIREAYGRVQRLAYRGWLITTTNGGNPAQEFYGELVNHATVQFPESVPKIELDEMVEDRPDEHYYHFNLHDDCPHKTAEQTERLCNSYPVGSFYHYSKILGCRGYAEGALYAQLLGDADVIPFEDLNLAAFEEVVATVDVGASVNGDDDSKSHTIVAIGGYTRQYHRVVAIASKKIESIEHRDIIDEAEEWLYKYWLKLYGKFKAILIDKADYKLVSTWQNHSRWRGKVSVLGCIKTVKDLCPDLPARAAVKCQLMMHSKQYPKSRIVWCDPDMLKAHRQILQDKDGSELDQANVWQDYFTQYDSYVTNLFSPQNEVDEWLTVKTSDSTYLISNNTAEIKTSRQITEIIEFDITYNGQTADALQYIFEESVYQVLTSDNPFKIKPAKGNALYYKLGTNIIAGLNYVPPAENEGTYTYSLKEICRRLFGISNPAELKFNDLIFHVKYRTQDELRISQVRPDIQNFMRNSSLEKYPHHEQYYGQQDKIIDSERFSANLFGQLIRVGNTEYQRQEYATDTDEKESGDLVTINDDAYYVIATENEYYPDAIKQKVTYSKNFNQLSKIVTIPSEPRFYEVSERSKIRREVRLMDFLELTTTKPTQAAHPRFLSNNKWKDLIKGLIFNKQMYTLPNFAYTKFVADYKRNHTGAYGQFVPNNELFPSSDVIRTSENTLEPKAPSDHSECIVSLLYFPLHDGIVFEWDMEDNFKAGDYVDTSVSGGNTVDKAYYAQQSHRYVDVMGRADLFTFRLFSKSNWTRTQAQQLPKAVEIPSESSCDIYLPSPYLIGLDKDNREALSFNYQINLLHRPTVADTEDFFTFPNLFGKKDSPLKMCLLSEPQSLFDENINLSPAVILADDVSYSLVDNSSLNAIEVRITTPSGVDLNAVNAIALYQDSDDGGRYAYIIKNVSKQPNNKKLQSWWLVPVFSD